MEPRPRRIDPVGCCVAAALLTLGWRLQLALGVRAIGLGMLLGWLMGVGGLALASPALRRWTWAAPWRAAGAALVLLLCWPSPGSFHHRFECSECLALEVSHGRFVIWGMAGIATPRESEVEMRDATLRVCWPADQAAAHEHVMEIAGGRSRSFALSIHESGANWRGASSQFIRCLNSEPGFERYVRRELAEGRVTHRQLQQMLLRITGRDREASESEVEAAELLEWQLIEGWSAPKQPDPRDVSD